MSCRRRDAREGERPELLGTLRDFSFEGLSIRLSPETPAPVTIGDVCSVIVESPSGPRIELQGEVRATPRGTRAEPPFVGLRIRPASHRHGVAWLDFIEQLQHPRVRTGSTRIDDVWALYERAGYFGLSGKRPADFEDRRAQYVESTIRALESPSVGLQAVWPEEGTPEATLAALRLYETAWLGFHMAKCGGPAKDGTPGRRVLRDIHFTIYERIERDPAARWIVGYTQVHKVWSRLCHHDVTARFARTPDATVWRFRAIEINAPPRSPALQPSTSVGLATATERDWVLAELAKRQPEPFLEALDLVPSRFDLREVRRRFWIAGLERERALFVARHEGMVVAAIVAELADEGLHLFRLLDHAIPFSLTPRGSAFFPHLFAAVHEFYASRRRSGWVLFLDAGAPAALFETLADFADLGEADMCILSTRRMPDFFEHLLAITAPRAISTPVGG